MDCWVVWALLGWFWWSLTFFPWLYKILLEIFPWGWVIFFSLWVGPSFFVFISWFCLRWLWTSRNLAIWLLLFLGIFWSRFKYTSCKTLKLFIIVPESCFFSVRLDSFRFIIWRYRFKVCWTCSKGVYWEIAVNSLHTLFWYFLFFHRSFQFSGWVHCFQSEFDLFLRWRCLSFLLDFSWFLWLIVQGRWFFRRIVRYFSCNRFRSYRTTLLLFAPSTFFSTRFTILPCPACF